MREYFVVYVCFNGGNSGYFYGFDKNRVTCKYDVKEARHFPGRKPAELTVDAIYDRFGDHVTDADVYCIRD